MWLMQKLWYCPFLLSPTFLYMQLMSEIFSCITWRHISFNRCSTELIIPSRTFISLYLLFESKIPWSNKLPSKTLGSHWTVHPLQVPPHSPASSQCLLCQFHPWLVLPCSCLGWRGGVGGVSSSGFFFFLPFCMGFSVFVSEPLWYLPIFTSYVNIMVLEKGKRY